MRPRTKENGIKGYKKSRVTNPPEDLDDELCGICGCVPVKGELCGECLQIFCSACIDGRAGKCPNGCKFIRRELIPLIAKSLSRLTLTCQNKEYGCTEIVKYKHLAAHEMTCEFAQISCGNKGCWVRLLKKELEVHLKTCGYTLLGCEWCHKKKKRMDLERHKHKCTCKPMECEDCRKKITLKVWKAHEAICPEKTLTCQQCATKYKRKDAGSHNCISNLQKMIMELHGIIEALSLKVEKLESDTNVCDKCMAKNNKCAACKVSFCTICSRIECHRCTIAFCKECSKEEMVECTRCFRFACKYVCETKCEECGREYCAGCLLACKRCKNKRCENCMKKCDKCGADSMCNDCVKRCTICKNNKCVSCATIAACGVCGRLACQKCLSPCKDCKIAKCTACERKCDYCKKEFCMKCGHLCPAIWGSTGTQVHIQTENVGTYMVTTTRHPLPKFFTATLRLANYKSCDKIGISSHKIYTEYGRDFGPSDRLDEYSLCIYCGTISHNKEADISLEAHKLWNSGTLKVTIDKGWKLKYELDGKSLNPDGANVIPGTYYLGLRSYIGNESFEIISIEEIK